MVGRLFRCVCCLYHVVVVMHVEVEGGALLFCGGRVPPLRERLGHTLVLLAGVVGGGGGGVCVCVEMVCVCERGRMECVCVCGGGMVCVGVGGNQLVSKPVESTNQRDHFRGISRIMLK